MKRLNYGAFLSVLMLAACAHAQVTLSNDKPVELSSDSLEVQQDKSQAIFSGNVIAKQGAINMRADKMVVHYTNKTAAPAAGMGNGVEKIDAVGNVIFTNASDTAKGDNATYDVGQQTLDLTGNVLLTRDKNVLKGTRLTYNLSTGRSVLTAGGTTVPGQTGGGRVHGLFVPDATKKE